MKANHPFYFVLLLAGVIFFNSCNSEHPPVVEGQATRVITQTVTKNQVSQEISVSGNVEGSKTVRLGFMVGGKINHIHVSAGQHIYKDELIATLDPTNYTIAKQIADVQVDQATDEYNRLKIMYDRSSISESDYKKIGFSLQAAKAQQKLQNKNLSDTRLFSPISGILLQKLAEPGEITAAGTAFLVVSDISKVHVNAYIPENQLHQIHIGQTAKVQIDALGKNFNGKVIEVGSTADVTTRAFTIKIEVANPTLAIRPGMIAGVTLPSAQLRYVLAVPANAILQTPEGQPYVFVADRKQAFQRKINIGRVYADKIEISSGLQVGEIIITGGQQKLSNGSKINNR